MKIQVVVLAVAVGGAAMWPIGARGEPAATATAPAVKGKTELKFETTEDAMRSYIEAWKNMEYASIMASVHISDPGKKKVVEVYTNYYMWRLALERACIAKFGEEEGMAALGHVRSLDKQFDVDLQRLLQSPNIDFDLKDRNSAHLFLRREKNRPEGLDATDDLNYRDDYWLVKSGGAWKVDFLKTYNLNDADPDRANIVRFNVDSAFGKIAKKLKELCEQVKKGEIKTAEEVKDKVTNEWTKIDVPEMTDPE